MTNPIWNHTTMAISTGKFLRLIKYLGPFVFLLGLAYTSLYPERKLLAASKVRHLSETAATPFDSSGTTVASITDDVPLSRCKVKFYSFIRYCQNKIYVRNVSKGPDFLWQTQIHRIEYGLNATIQTKKKVVFSNILFINVHPLIQIFKWFGCPQ